MKKIEFRVLFSVGILMLAGSLLATNSQNNGANFSSANQEALNESAGEMWCDQSNEKSCTIEAPSGHIGRSTGILSVIWI